MTTVTRTQFFEALGGEQGFIDINHLDAKTQRSLASAGIDKHQLDAIAGDDGLIAGKAEMNELFGLVDSFDANGSAGSFALGDPSVDTPTASGELFGALKEEADAQLRDAHLAGVSGATARSTNPRKMDDKALVGEAEATRTRLESGKNYPLRNADVKKLAKLDTEIDRRYVKRTGVQDPHKTSDGTTWAERQTGRCMTNLEIYEHTLQNAPWTLSPELEAYAQEQSIAFRQYSTVDKLWPDGKIMTSEQREQYLTREYVTRGAAALTANLFGALAWGASGLVSDDPWFRLGAAELGANVGGMANYAAAFRPANVTLIAASREPVLFPAGPVPLGHKNAKVYPGPTHIYMLTRSNPKTGKNEFVKYGVGSTGETTAGLSKRAGEQVRDKNAKDTDGWIYKAVIIDRTPPNRGEAYNMERDYVTDYKMQHDKPPPGNDKPSPWDPGVDYHKRPWTDPK